MLNASRDRVLTTYGGNLIHHLGALVLGGKVSLWPQVHPQGLLRMWCKATVSKVFPSIVGTVQVFPKLETSLLITGELSFISRSKAKQGIFQAVGIIYDLNQYGAEGQVLSPHQRR